MQAVKLSPNETVLPTIMSKGRRLDPLFYYGNIEASYNNNKLERFDESDPLHNYQIMKMQTSLSQVAKSIRHHRNMTYFLNEYVWAGWTMLQPGEEVNWAKIKLSPIRPNAYGMDSYQSIEDFYLVVVRCLALNYGNVPPTFESFIAKVDKAYFHHDSDELIVVDYKPIPGTNRHLFGQRVNHYATDFHQDENVYAYMSFAGARMLLNEVNSHWSFIWQPVPDLHIRSVDDSGNMDTLASFDRFPCVDRLLYKSDSVHVTGGFVYLPSLLPWITVRISKEYSGSHVFGMLNDGYVFRISW